MQILKALLFILCILNILIGGIFVIGLLNFHEQPPAPEGAFKNKKPDRAAFYLTSIQSELQRMADAAKLFK